MSVTVAVLSERTSLVLALTMLVPDWDVEAVRDPAELEPGRFDAVIIESATTEEGLAHLDALASPGFVVVVGDADAEPRDGVVVVPRPFTVADLRDLIQNTVAPPPPPPAVEEAPRGRGQRRRFRRNRSEAEAAFPLPVGAAEAHPTEDEAPGTVVDTPDAPPSEESSPDADALFAGAEDPETIAHDEELATEAAFWRAEVEIAEQEALAAPPEESVRDAQPALDDEALVELLDDEVDRDALEDAATDDEALAGVHWLGPDRDEDVDGAAPAVPLPHLILDLSALERHEDPLELPTNATADEADDEVVEVLGGYEYVEPRMALPDVQEPEADDTFAEEGWEPVTEAEAPVDETDHDPSAEADEAVAPMSELPLPPVPAARPPVPAATQPTEAPRPLGAADIPPPPGAPARAEPVETIAGPVLHLPAEEPADPGPGLQDVVRDRVSAWRDRRDRRASISPSGSERAGAVTPIDTVALLAETLNAFDPVTSAVWVLGEDGAWHAEAQLGLRPAESRRHVPADQPLFAALTSNRHGILLSPADLARGYLAGVPGTWTEDVIAAAVPGRRGACTAIVVVGSDRLTPRNARRLVALAEESGARSASPVGVGSG